MKTWIAMMMVLLCIVSLTGCGEKMPDGLPQQQDAQTYSARVERIDADQPASALTGEETETLLKLLNKGRWINDRTKCESDCLLTLNGKIYYYHSECGSFNDAAGGRSLTLDEEGRLAVNGIFERYISLGFMLEPAAADWGITLMAEDVTATGMTIVCTHAGEAPDGELQTGSPFWLERKVDGAWEKVPYILPEEQIAWDMLAYLIHLNGSTRWEVNWTWLYGELPLGEVYRLGKEIQLFRGPGDYETRAVYTDEFAFVD